MSGMGGAQGLDDQLIVSSFHHTLAGQARIVLVVLVLAVAVTVFVWPMARLLREGVRSAESEIGGGDIGEPVAPRSESCEPPGRRMLRFGFALLWLLDGALQLQPHMPTGLPGGVVAPAAAGSPSWLRDVVRFGVGIWERHPVQAAVAAVWIQLGLGLWLALVARGRWSRLGGLASVGWALTVWVFGESMGGMLAPGASWLFGAPGAVLLYALAGALLALPEAAWRSERLGRRLLSGFGAFFVAMALLQAWPGRGFWQGHGNAISSMATEMAATPQPHLLRSLVADFAMFSARHPVVVNGFVVCALAGIGTALLSTRPRATRAGLASAVVVCLADWVLVQDIGVFGGTGTDPNSALPTLILLSAGYLAVVRPPVPRTSTRTAALPVRAGGRARYIAVVAAAGITALGAVPLSIAAAEPNATTLLATSIDGPASAVGGNLRPPNVRLVDQHGRRVTFADLRGKVVLMTYLDPVCNSDCPVIAQEFKQADGLLGGDARRVDLVAIDANPLYRSTSVLQTFDRQERLQGLPNWLYLTGSLRQLRRVWSEFEVGVSVPGGGAMVVHALGAAVLDPEGRVRWIANFDPGPATSSTESSFAVTLADLARRALIS